MADAKIGAVVGAGSGGVAYAATVLISAGLAHFGWTLDATTQGALMTLLTSGVAHVLHSSVVSAIVAKAEAAIVAGPVTLAPATTSLEVPNA